jgi:hypothetical protein
MYTTNLRALKAPASWIRVRDAAIASLEDLLLYRWLGFALAGFLFAVSLPFLAVLWLVDQIGRRSAGVLRQNRSRTKAGSSAFQASWTANEFQFADAIKKYEELIDATARRRR